MGALDRERASLVPALARTLRPYPAAARPVPRPGAPRRPRRASCNGRILDSTATLAARTLASGLMSGVTSPARPWFRLGVGIPRSRQCPRSAPGSTTCRRRMLRVFARSNLYNALATVYEELGVFGSAALLVLEDDEEIVRAWPLTVGEYWLASSERLRWSTRSTASFPSPCSSSSSASAATRSRRWCASSTTRHVGPRGHGRPRDRAQRGGRDARETVGCDRQPQHGVPLGLLREERRRRRLLSVSGFEAFPAMCPRWHLVGNDV